MAESRQELWESSDFKSAIFSTAEFKKKKRQPCHVIHLLVIDEHRNCDLRSTQIWHSWAHAGSCADAGEEILPQQRNWDPARGRQLLKSIGLHDEAQRQEEMGLHFLFSSLTDHQTKILKSGMPHKYFPKSYCFVSAANQCSPLQVPPPPPHRPYVSISGDFTLKHSAFFSAGSLVFHEKPNIS